MEPITNEAEIKALFVTIYPEHESPSDYGEAAVYASWKPDEVASILATSDGENDGANWLMVVELKDGRFSFLSAGCDYTGWDCQAGGSSQEYPTLAALVQFGLGMEERERLNMPLPSRTEVK